MQEEKNMETLEKLKKYNQTRTLKLIENLSKDKAKSAALTELLKSLETVDFDELFKIYNESKQEVIVDETKIKQLPYLVKKELNPCLEKLFYDLGTEVLNSGQYAVVTMAGGQGTRLGHDGPKGTYSLDIDGSRKFIFEILKENLEETNQKTGKIIPWYIMTSPENDAPTKNFFKNHDYFNYSKEDITFFKQNHMPLIDVYDQLLIDKNYHLKEASDGTGSVYRSLKNGGCLEDMKTRGIKWVFIGGVDNILLKQADRILLGMAIFKNVEIASKTIVKSYPEEKVGLFCQYDNHPRVIEYSEMPIEISYEEDENHELKYKEAHIMCNLYTIDALEYLAEKTLPYHIAFKKNSYLDEFGTEIIPKEPNSYKLESFLFDGFPYFDNIALLRGDREEDFAPIKNKEGKDSSETAKVLYKRYHATH